MQRKIEVKKLPLGEFTEEGSYYSKVDGSNIGEAGRAFWRTEEEARQCANRFVRISELLAAAA